MNTGSQQNATLQRTGLLQLIDNYAEDNPDGCKATHRLGNPSNSTKETIG
jgi:hypothetical protein